MWRLFAGLRGFRGIQRFAGARASAGRLRLAGAHALRGHALNFRGRQLTRRANFTNRRAQLHHAIAGRHAVRAVGRAMFR